MVGSCDAARALRGTAPACTSSLGPVSNTCTSKLPHKCLLACVARPQRRGWAEPRFWSFACRLQLWHRKDSSFARMDLRAQLAHVLMGYQRGICSHLGATDRQRAL